MADDPLRVDWLPPALLADALPGKLGLTFLPGKQGASMRYPGRIYRRDLDQDLAALREAGVSRLLLLVEDTELARWGTPDRPPSGWVPPVVRFPMPDGTAPAEVTMMDEILAAADAGRGDGPVAVACMGGGGRTGTGAACALVRAGMHPATAIDEVRRVRHPTAVETAEQEAFVRAYARHRSVI